MKAIEPDAENVLSLKMSKCMNFPQVADNIEVLEYGLGKEAKYCSLYVKNEHKSNGIVICDTSAKIPNDYS